MVTILLSSLAFARLLLAAVRYSLTCRCCRRRQRMDFHVSFEEKLSDALYETEQQAFPYFYHKENPVYSGLPEEVNAQLFDKETTSKTIGTRDGPTVHDYMAERGHLEAMFSHLQEV